MVILLQDFDLSFNNILKYMADKKVVMGTIPKNDPMTNIWVKKLFCLFIAQQQPSASCNNDNS